MRKPPRATRSDTLVRYTTLVRSHDAILRQCRGPDADPGIVGHPQNGRLSGRRAGRFAGQDPQIEASTRAAVRASGRESARSNPARRARRRSEEHTSELQSLMRISYAVFCLQKKSTKLKSRN